VEDLFSDAGSLEELYAGVDWAATPLGPVSSWSPTLLSILRTMWQTRFAVTLFWGPDQALIYNEAYVTLIADKHPAAFGAPARDVFPEIWDTIGPMLDTAVAGDGGTWVQDLRLMMDRRGFLEETYFTFSYSAVIGPTGKVEGVIDVATETTAQVLADRRLRLLHQLTDELADVEHRGHLLERALPLLRSVPDDLAQVTLLVLASDEPLEEPGPAGESVTLVKDDEGTAVHVRLADASAEGDYGVLMVRLSPYLPVDDAYLGFVRLIGATLTQALDRIERRRADRVIASLERAMSEALQESLLTHPAQHENLQVAVRYQSSVAQSHIGGDWYDAFQLPDGTLTVAVGDVSGHDRAAATAMAQIRNVLRGIAYTITSPPSRILEHLNTAMIGLPVDAFATVVLAQVAPGATGGVLRWSNAGHPPPALLLPDGAVRILDTPPEVLLGTRAAAWRSDHTVYLEPGTTAIFYTDGLIERRLTTIDEGQQELARALAGRQSLDAEELCDHLLAEFAPTAEDDIALTVIRTGR
jgi:hypothetical protein